MANGTSMTISNTGSTKMMCHDPGVMSQESVYLATLASVARYQINGTLLVLLDSNGTTILTFAGQL